MSPKNPSSINKLVQSVQIDTESEQSLWGLGRVILVFLFIILFSFVGGTLFETVDTTSIAIQLHNSNPILGFIPLGWIEAFVYIFIPAHLRYAIAPTAALVCILLAGSRYVQDIYELTSLRDAWSYIMTSMFGLNYPSLVIDMGERKLQEDKINLLDKIGGPGHVIIQPGNAVLFRMLRNPSRASVTRSYFLTPFETVGQIANLDDQDGHLAETETMTRDGILIKLTDVNFRYRILSIEVDGKPINRSLENPYPYSESAMHAMAYNLSVTKDGRLESWHGAVQRNIVGVITDFINSHNLDELTAPGKVGRYDPRDVLRKEFMMPARRTVLRGLGVELIWIDVGHIEIKDLSIDERRMKWWAADWLGDAKAIRAYGEARSEAYMELGRAEAQAELLMGIAHMLENVDFKSNLQKNMRTILISSVSQILDGMRDANKIEDKLIKND